MPEIGFQRSQLIDMAHRRTEGRAKSLDSNAEFALALQEVALDMRWWWRRKIVSFTVLTGVPTYELTGDGSLHLEDLQQIPRDGMKLLTPGGGIIRPVPVFDMETQQEITSFQSLQQPARPTRYFLAGAAPGQFHFDPVPDRDYPASLAYWAIPIYNLGGAAGEEEQIPLVPAYLHGLILKRLEMRFLSFAPVQVEKYKIAQAEYEDAKNNADQFENFAEGEVKSFASNDWNDSVRST